MYVAEALEKQIAAAKFLAACRERPEALDHVPPEAREPLISGNDLYILRRATTMYWSHKCVDAVRSAAGAFDLSAIAASRELLYCDLAFCWFESPWLKLEAPDPAQSEELCALSWYWALSDDCDRQRPFLGITAWGQVDGTPRPVLWIPVYEGEPLSSCTLHHKAQRDSEEARLLMQFVVSASTFLRQKLLSVDSNRVERHARKRIAAIGWEAEPLVSVVALRARESRHEGATDGEHAHVEWSHQWIVRGHVRQQFYPSLGSNLPLWIHPHIKGPEDRPLKPRTTPIFAVTR